MPVLHGLDSRQKQQAFLRDFWQQQALLLPAALRDFDDPLDANDLAGLATMEDACSRIVYGPDFTVEHGPFTDDRLLGLPDSHSTLLVQAVEDFVPELLELRDAFSFIPAWRFEDIMVSFATPGGSVGPHYDHYDVFLIQGVGCRRWKIGQQCDQKTAVRQVDGQQLINQFSQQQEYTLSQGDILYLPPGLAHWGIADEASLTYSVGFRAPSYREFIGEWAYQAEQQLSEWQRFQCSPGTYQAHSGGGVKSIISEQDIARISHELSQLCSDHQLLADTLGLLQTELPEQRQPPAVNFRPDWQWFEENQALISGLRRSTSARLCYACVGGLHTVYCNGEKRQLPGVDPDWVDILCESKFVQNSQLREHCENPAERQCHSNRELLRLVIANGAWEIEEHEL